MTGCFLAIFKMERDYKNPQPESPNHFLQTMTGITSARLPIARTDSHWVKLSIGIGDIHKKTEQHSAQWLMKCLGEDVDPTHGCENTLLLFVENCTLGIVVASERSLE